MIAYHLSGDSSDFAEHNISQERAAELQAQGWLLSETPIFWVSQKYEDGQVVDRYPAYVAPVYVETVTANDTVLANDVWNTAGTLGNWPE